MDVRLHSDKRCHIQPLEEVQLQSDQLWQMHSDKRCHIQPLEEVQLQSDQLWQMHSDKRCLEEMNPGTLFLLVVGSRAPGLLASVVQHVVMPVSGDT